MKTKKKLVFFFYLGWVDLSFQKCKILYIICKFHEELKISTFHSAQVYYIYPPFAKF